MDRGFFSYQIVELVLCLVVWLNYLTAAILL